MKITRREVLIAGAALAACGPDANDDYDPLAQWTEDEDMQLGQPQPVPSRSKMIGVLYDPLVLSAETTIQPGADSAPNVTALKNPHGVPMELLAVRFSLYVNQPGVAFGSVTGGAVGVKMDLGSIALVDSAVPLSCFSSFRDSVDPNGQSSVIVSQSDASITSAESFYDWRLKYPLYIPANATVVPTFTHFGQVQYPLTVRVTYFCRTYRQGTPKPSKYMVPWVTSYNSKVFDMVDNTPAAFDESNEQRLVNNFGVPIEITRLVGRYTFMQNESSLFVPKLNNELTDRLDISRLIELRISTSRGDELARDQTIFDGLFPANWCAWDFSEGWYMEPTEYWKILLNRGAVDFTVENEGRIQVFVGLVGYREVTA